MMNWPENFFKNENRNGFVVSEVMKRSWATDLDALVEFFDLCERNSLKIFACYGTLLGAVRDKGFIAWDDDIDMGLVGEDYVRFLDIVSKELGEKYRILNPYTRDWYSMNFTHITDSADADFSRGKLKKKHGCPFGTGPDIYPYYYVPRNADEEAYILELLKKIDYVMALNRQSLSERKADGSINVNSRLNEAVARQLVELQYETGYEFTMDRPIENQLEILYDQVCRVTEEADADYVARYDEYCKDKNKKFPKEYFETTVKLPFENIYMPVPIGYDAVLKARFGESYIVPRREAAAHDYPYYRKQLVGKDYIKEQQETDMAQISDFPTRKEDNKTKILYYTNIVTMLIYCDKAVDKISETLDSFSTKDCEFWWMPGVFPKTDECAWDEVAPEMIERCERLIKDYRKKGGRICSISENIEDVVAYFDEFIGDEGNVAEEFVKAGKSTKIQDYLDIKEGHTTEANDNQPKNIVKAEVPAGWRSFIYKDNGIKKKVVMYVSSVSVLFQNQKNALSKIKTVFDLFVKQSDDVALLWYLPDISDEVKSAFDTSFLRQLEELKESIAQTKKVILMDMDQTDAAISIIDAVYGDPDSVIALCRRKGIPVMIQNNNI